MRGGNENPTESHSYWGLALIRIGESQILRNVGLAFLYIDA